MEREMFTPNRLFCPGPTPTPWAVKASYLETDIYHRSKEFESLFLQCATMLKPLFGSETNPLILTSSGTGAMEAAVTNLTNVGDGVIVLVAGKFGERWEKIVTSYGCQVEVVRVGHGKVPRASDLGDAFRRMPRPKVVFFQAHETSTGARLPVEELIDEIKRHSKDALIVVDAISSLGAHPISMTGMGIDCLISGSQKGFGVAPGLSFIALSDRAWRGLSTRPKFYFDLAKERKSQESGRSAYTPAISIVLGLYASLTEISKQGITAFINHHARLGAATRAAVKSWGMDLFVEEVAQSNVLTAVKVPPSLDGVQILATAKARYGAIISGGQDDLKGKIIRFSHLGFVSPFQLIEGLAALEFALADLGWSFSLGSGVASAMKVLKQPVV